MRSIILGLCLVLAMSSVAVAGKNKKKSSVNPCPNGIEKRLFMFNPSSGRYKSVVNPYDNVGKCFEIQHMEVLQLLSRNVALCGAWEPFALIEFGKQSAPADSYRGIVKGIGAYQYTSAGGSLVTVHHFKALNPEELDQVIAYSGQPELW